MKIARRIGVFETNSSSTHTLILLDKDEWERDADKYKKYCVLTDLKDKLYMACGCCEEIFAPESRADEERKKVYAESRKVIMEQNGYSSEGSDAAQEGEYYNNYQISYELTIELLVRGYCEISGEDYSEIHEEIERINHSGRACHMAFFYEGALYDAESDYGTVYDLFVGWSDEIREKIAEYYRADKVLCYREYYAGIGYDDD